MSDLVAWTVLGAYGAVLLALLPFSLHRAWLLRVAGPRRDRRVEEGPALRDAGAACRGTDAQGATPPGSAALERLPHVTVQLPVYDERDVVERLIDAACRLDHPAHLLEVQVLDDSTDDTTARAEARAEAWRARGRDVRVLHRDDRTGFKAGALRAGAARAKGEFFLVLDADFLPPPDLLRHLLPPFRDPRVGMVQARWDHLNEGENRLTLGQALLLDGHFFLEHEGRQRSGRFFNFNGTAGVWRRSCLEEAGGWQDDTLTEDLDLSYRAQMRGWRFVFLDDVGVPAELPARAAALEVQQRRWAQGGLQTARKVLPELWRGGWSSGIKLEATLHLCGHLAHPLTLALGLLLLPAALARRSLGLDHLLPVDLVLFCAATVPFLAFYAVAGRRRDERSVGATARGVVAALATGIGLSVPVGRAALRGLLGGVDPFHRTPKAGGGRSSYVVGGPPLDRAVRVVVVLLLLVCLGVAVRDGLWSQLPFLLLFLTGHLWLALPVAAARAGRLGGAGGAAVPTGAAGPTTAAARRRSPGRSPGRGSR